MTALPHAFGSAPSSTEASFERAVTAAVRAAFHSATGTTGAEHLDDVERQELVGSLEQLRGVLYDLLAQVDAA